MAKKELLRGPKAHSVSWVLNQDWCEGTVTCHCSEGADCRMWCPQGCESWSLTDHEHELVDYGTCMVVEWLEASGVLECHLGKHAPVDGFITPEYDGDGWTWTYADG